MSIRYLCGERIRFSGADHRRHFDTRWRWANANIANESKNKKTICREQNVHEDDGLTESFPDEFGNEDVLCITMSWVLSPESSPKDTNRLGWIKNKKQNTIC